MPSRPPVHRHSRPTREINQTIRNRTNTQVYNHAWRKLRKEFLRQHPLCVNCQAMGFVTEATEADHIVPIKKGGAILDTTNLQSLCKPCHSRKTASENTSDEQL